MIVAISCMKIMELTVRTLFIYMNCNLVRNTERRMVARKNFISMQIQTMLSSHMLMGPRLESLFQTSKVNFFLGVSSGKSHTTTSRSSTVIFSVRVKHLVDRGHIYVWKLLKLGNR